MRFFKKTIFWLIILAVISGVFYFFDEKVTEKEIAQEELRRLFTFEPADVISIEISKGGSVILVKKGTAGWVIEKPIMAYADQTAINDMLNNTVKAKVDGVLFKETTADKLKEMGLEPPYITITLKTATGISTSLSLGDRGPTLNVAFAILSGDKRILRVHADVRSEIDKMPYDFRDKTVVAMDPRTVKEVDILWNDKKAITVFHPQENVWDTEGVPEGKSDLTKILNTLYVIKKAKVKAFIDENPQSLSTYGLDKPRLKIKFIDNKNLLETLLIGEKEKKLRGFYAKRGGDRNVFLLEEEFLDGIPGEASDLEVKEK